MTRLMSRVAAAAAIVCATSVLSLAQQPQTTSSTDTKSFEVIGIDGNQLIVRMPEGTREVTVPDDFRFTVNGQPMSLSQLKPGMKGTATITTRTTVTPVTVTEVKNGTVVQRTGSGIIVRTDEGVKSFTQGDVDKRGVKMMREGKPAQLSDFREGDRLSATIVTSRPPRVMTEKEVQAIVPTAAAPPVAATRAPSASPTTTRSAAAPARAVPAPQAQAQTTQTARTLPHTASSWPLLALASVLSLAMGLALIFARRLVR